LSTTLPDSYDTVGSPVPQGSKRPIWYRSAHSGIPQRSDRVAKNRLTRRRNRLLEQENEVLRRAAAYLSQANLPGKSSTRS